MALLGDDLEHDAAVVLPSFFEDSQLAMSKDLSDDQKQILKEYINSVDSTPDLRNFYNIKITELKSTLSKITKEIKDKASQDIIQLRMELGTQVTDKYKKV